MPVYPASPYNWIDGLPEAAHDALQRTMVPHLSRTGGDVYTPSTRARGLYRVLAGRAQMYVIGAQGQQILFRHYEPGETFGEVATLDLQNYPVFVSIDAGSSVGFVAHERVTALSQEFPEIRRAVEAAVCLYVRILMAFLVSALTRNAQDRVRDRLVWLADARPGGMAAGPVRTTQADLADMLGLSRQSVNEALAALEASGHVRRSRGAIELLVSSFAPSA
ncbi:MAG: Crp/Fnr family transcriptional regulator [Parvibaculum sp.]|nr:Crp/Fnr family transcriptional regulator [Parvibaculum sp.]